jgi:hypothetical protein
MITHRVRVMVVSTMISLGAVSASYGGEDCERETIAMTSSPDGKWMALVREGECSDGRIVTVSTDTVQLVPRSSLETIPLERSPDQPRHENDVLVVDYYGHFESRPVLQWLSPRQLQVTIPNLSGIGMQKSSYQDVAIVLRFDPDDPVAREKWRKQRDLLR